MRSTAELQKRVSENREGSQNSWSSRAGEALGQKTVGGIVEENSNTNLQKKASEYEERSQNLRSGEVAVAVKQTEELAALMFIEDAPLKASKDSKSS